MVTDYQPVTTFLVLKSINSIRYSKYRKYIISAVKQCICTIYINIMDGKYKSQPLAYVYINLYFNILFRNQIQKRLREVRVRNARERLREVRVGSACERLREVRVGSAVNAYVRYA